MQLTHFGRVAVQPAAAALTERYVAALAGQRRHSASESPRDGTFL